MTKHREIYHQSLAVIPIFLCEFSMGLGFGWIAPTIKSFLEDPASEIKPTEEECSWIASMPGFGRTFGPLFSILLMDILGRKFMIQSVAALFSITWLAILFTRSTTILVAAFFIFGFAIGISNAVMAVYLGENSSPNLRGIFCSVSVTGFYSAVLLQFTTVCYLPYNITAMINLAVTIFCFVCCTLLTVESPQFLILNDKFDRAEVNMMWLKGTNNKDDIIDTFEAIKSNIASEKLKKTSYKKLFSTTANYKSLIIVITLNMAHTLTGNSAIFTYISILLPSSEFFTTNQIILYFGISQFVFCIFTSFVIERCNRRSLTLFSFALFILCHSICAYFLYNSATNGPPSSGVLWIMLVSICIFSGFSAAMDSVVHSMRGELFPQSIKPIGSGLAISAHSLMQFLTTKIFLSVKTQYGIHANFLGYAVTSFASFCFCYFYLPETRGKTLLEIQSKLEKRKEIL